MALGRALYTFSMTPFHFSKLYPVWLLHPAPLLNSMKPVVIAYFKYNKQISVDEFINSHSKPETTRAEADECAWFGDYIII